jgi:hypothetical protein
MIATAYPLLREADDFSALAASLQSCSRVRVFCFWQAEASIILAEAARQSCCVYKQLPCTLYWSSACSQYLQPAVVCRCADVRTLLSGQVEKAERENRTGLEYDRDPPLQRPLPQSAFVKSCLWRNCIT